MPQDFTTWECRYKDPTGKECTDETGKPTRTKEGDKHCRICETAKSGRERRNEEYEEDAEEARRKKELAAEAEAQQKK